MDSNRHIQTGSNGVDRYEDEIELMDYILVIWKWKYLILGGTLAFTFVAAIISFIALKQQPTMYRTSIVLKPGVLEIDRSGHKVFIDTPENIKTLIENDLKFRVLEQNSNNIKLSTELDFQLDIPKGSNIINVSLVSALADVGTMKLNYLIKALSAEFQNKIKYIKNNKIEAKKIKIASHEANEVMARKKVEDNIKLKKDKLDELSFKEKSIKAKIKKYQHELSEREAKINILKNSNDISQSKEYILNKLSIENDYRNAFQKYFELNENAKYNLFKLQKKIFAVANEIKDLEKTKDNIKADSFLQPNLYKIQKDIIDVSKELKKLEKGKNNIQNQ